MAIEPHPVRLVKLGSLRAALGTEVLMRGGEDASVGWWRLNKLSLSGQDVFGGLDVVKIPVGLLFLGADLPVVVFEFLGGREAWQ